MPKAKYDTIYRDLKEQIESEAFAYQELLPSEHTPLCGLLSFG